MDQWDPFKEVQRENESLRRENRYNHNAIRQPTIGLYGGSDEMRREIMELCRTAEQLPTGIQRNGTKDGATYGKKGC